MRYTHRLCALLVLLAAGCAPGSGKADKAVSNAVKNQPDVRAFAAVFPASEHFITHYDGTAGPRVWNSRVLLHERYVLTMQFDMTLDASGVTVTAVAPPTYHLAEITKVTAMPNGRVMTERGPSGESVEFGPAEWNKVEAAGGDLSVLGIKPKLAQPVQGLKKHWQG